MEAIRVGVIGCGYWGPKLARNFHELSDAELRVVADLDEERLAHMKEAYPYVAATRDYAELLETDVDAVAVATPVSTHFEIARDVLRHDKHLLVEKPLTNDGRQAQTLIDLAQERELTLMVGHTFEYNPAVEKLKEIIANGEIGDVYYVNAARVNLGIFQQDINVVWDLAPHDVSILRFILDLDPVSVSARGNDYVQPGIQDVAYLSLTFPRDITAHIRVSWLDPNKIRRITVVGSEKMAVYDDVEPLDKIKIYDKGVEVPPYTDTYGDFQLSYRYGDISIPKISMAEPLKVECSHFLECIRQGKEPRSGGQVGLRVVQVLESAQKSLLNGGISEEIVW